VSDDDACVFDGPLSSLAGRWTLRSVTLGISDGTKSRPLHVVVWAANPGYVL
jgi:hypothetical protein